MSIMIRIERLLRTCSHASEWPLVGGVTWAVGLPFFIVLCSLFHMEDGVVLGGGGGVR